MSQYDDDFDRWCQFGDQDDDWEPHQVKCKFCSKRDLYWHRTQRWALIDEDGAVHDCRTKPATVDDFADLGD